jgi:hypothetical protein
LSPNITHPSSREHPRLRSAGLAASLLAIGALGCVESRPTAAQTAAVVSIPVPPDGDPGDPGATDTSSPGAELTPEGLCQVTVECGGGILDEPKSPCTMQVVDAAGVSQYDGPAGFELRGRSSGSFPKPHYGLELRTHTELPVWPGGTWSYLDEGVDLGTSWTDPAFDDSDWAEGSAPFGYGGEYLDTVTDDGHGPDGRSLTTYFRREFTPGDLPAITGLLVGLQSRDGAAVYLNGTEILRQNLPAGAAYDEGAIAALEGEDTPWVTLELTPGLVVEGTNTLAVEVHLASIEREELRFNLYLEAHGDDAPATLLDMGKEADWILNGQYVDRALFRNRLAFDLFQDMGDQRFATDTRFCELELDGEYLGIYTLGEKLERDDDRIDIGPGATPGESFIVKLDDEEGFHDNGVGPGTWQLVHPDPTPNAEAVVADTLTRWEDAILGPDPADPETGIFSLVDLDSAVDWVLLNEFMKNHDAYILSVYLWKGETGKMFFAPWDLDLSMGYPYTDCDGTGWLNRDWYPGGGESRDIDFVERMVEVPAFHDALVARWRELREGELSEDAILARIRGYDATLAPALEANLAQWPIEEITFSFSDVDNWLCPVQTYDEEHERTLAFVSERLAWMDENIEDF